MNYKHFCGACAAENVAQIEFLQKTTRLPPLLSLVPVCDIYPCVIVYTNLQPGAECVQAPAADGNAARRSAERLSGQATEHPRLMLQCCYTSPNGALAVSAMRPK